MFGRMAQWTAAQTGRAPAFACALALVLVWAATGPLFDWSDSHALFINTATTIVTFLMVFLLQYAQDRDTQAIHAKLDGLIAGCDATSNQLLDLEKQPKETVEQVRQQIVDDNRDD